MPGAKISELTEQIPDSELSSVSEYAKGHTLAGLEWPGGAAQPVNIVQLPAPMLHCQALSGSPFDLEVWVTGNHHLNLILR